MDAFSKTFYFEEASHGGTVIYLLALSIFLFKMIALSTGPFLYFFKLFFYFFIFIPLDILNFIILNKKIYYDYHKHLSSSKVDSFDLIFFVVIPDHSHCLTEYVSLKSLLSAVV